jgi:hypothetical protein
VQADEIVDRDSFDTWLKARPPSTMAREAAILSLRTALRVMPNVVVPKTRISNVLSKLTYAVLRCAVFSRSIVFTQKSDSKWFLDAAFYSNAFASELAATLQDTDFSAFSMIHAANSSAFSAASSADPDNNLDADYASISSAASAVDFASAAPILAAISVDAAIIRISRYNALLRIPLWPENAQPPEGFADPEPLREHFRAVTNGHVWLRWYDRMLSGARASDEEEILYAHEELLPLWEKDDNGVAVSAWLAEKLAELDAREALDNKPAPAPHLPDISDFGSPIAVLNPNGKIGLTRNPVYDTIDLGTDGLELVHAQQANIRVFTAGLPTQAPEFLRFALNEYQASLPIEGEGGMALTLDIQAGVILREIKSQAAQEWMNDGVLVVSESFSELHPKIAALARENKKREKALADAPFDEAKAENPAIRQALKDLADEAVKAVAANVIEPEVAEQLRKDLRTLDSLPDIKPGDRPAPPAISPKKRFWFARFGLIKSLNAASAAITVIKDAPAAATILFGLAEKLLEMINAFF